MIKSKILSFDGETIYCGIDVHKKSWKVNIRTRQMELDHFSLDPNPEILISHLKTRYPEADFRVAYEAGFSGFWACREFNDADIDCIVINAADVPTTDKDNKQKSDTIDARKIARELSKDNLRAVHVPLLIEQNYRDLVRVREQLVTDQSRCKSRIRHKLLFNGIKIVEEKEKYWTRAFIDALEKHDYGNDYLKIAVNLLVGELKDIRKKVLEATAAVRKLAQSDAFREQVKILRSIPGIGLINSMVILTEIGEINRFKSFDHLCSYVGFVPSTADSGERKSSRGITQRCNYRLRTALVESSWAIIRKDPAMLMKYCSYCKRMEKNKALIKIGKHLLSRIKYVLVNKVEYVQGVVA